MKNKTVYKVKAKQKVPYEPLRTKRHSLCFIPEMEMGGKEFEVVKYYGEYQIPYKEHDGWYITAGKNSTFIYHASWLEFIKRNENNLFDF